MCGRSEEGTPWLIAIASGFAMIGHAASIIVLFVRSNDKISGEEVITQPPNAVFCL